MSHYKSTMVFSQQQRIKVLYMALWLMDLEVLPPPPPIFEQKNTQLNAFHFASHLK